MSRAALGLAPATTSLIRNLMPLVRFEVDDAIVASVAAPPATSQRGELSGRPPANDRDKQRGAHGVSNKTRKCQKDSTKHGGDAGGLQMHRPEALLGEGGAEAREVGASGLSQQQDAHDRRGNKKGSRPQPADQARHHDERKQLRRRKRDQPNKRPL